MRVIAGSARRLLLKTIEGMDTRPTTDRIKETLFNMMQNEIYGCTFLDLYSGSGAIGIEALSRGAKKAVFVEHNREAVECIRENLRTTGLEERAVILYCDAGDALMRLSKQGDTFDIIFMDPPYDRLYEKDMLELLSRSSLIREGTLVIVEASSHTQPDYLPKLGFRLIREKQYKTNKHLFLTMERPPAIQAIDHTKGDTLDEDSNLSGQL